MAIAVNRPPMRRTPALTGRSEQREPRSGAAACSVTHGETRLERARSLDHLVGAGQHQGRHRKTACLCGLEVEHEFELGGQYDREIAWCSAFQNPPDIDAALTKRIRDVVAITHQAAIHRKLTIRVDRGHRMLRCKRDDAFALIS